MRRFEPNDVSFFYLKVVACCIAHCSFSHDYWHFIFHCSFVDMLNVISTCRDILCVDINVDKRCVDHSTSDHRYWKRDPRTPIPPHVMASSAMELKLGIQVFAAHSHGNKCKQNASMIFARCGAFHTCLSSRSDHSTYIHLTQLFWLQEKPRISPLEPHT